MLVAAFGHQSRIATCYPLTSRNVPESRIAQRVALLEFEAERSDAVR